MVLRYGIFAVVVVAGVAIGFSAGAPGAAYVPLSMIGSAPQLLGLAALGWAVGLVGRRLPWRGALGARAGGLIGAALMIEPSLDRFAMYPIRVLPYIPYAVVTLALLGFHLWWIRKRAGEGDAVMAPDHTSGKPYWAAIDLALLGLALTVANYFSGRVTLTWRITDPDATDPIRAGLTAAIVLAGAIVVVRQPGLPRARRTVPDDGEPTDPSPGQGR